jgi:A/G-specific adenine glycosylase
MSRLPNAEDLRSALLPWFRANARALPWRGTRDPYAILVSEVLLQQTRVEQARGYYTRFVEAFPDFAALARAAEEEVLRVWAGAGYYRRAKNLHRLAQVVAETGLPATAAALQGLPGIGPYTAAAVASIAFGEPVAAVDGNVRRVLARLFGRKNPAPRWLRDTAQRLLDPCDPGTWNQALMELGATVCTPRNPGCPVCPVARFCVGKRGPERYPAPKRRTQRAVEAVSLALRGSRGYVLEKRNGQMLGGLWGFPLAEGDGALSSLLAQYGLEDAQFLGTVNHAFTHKRLTIAVYAAPWSGSGEDPAHRPLSRLDQKILALAACAGNLGSADLRHGGLLLARRAQASRRADPRCTQPNPEIKLAHRRDR